MQPHYDYEQRFYAWLDEVLAYLGGAPGDYSYEEMLRRFTEFDPHGSFDGGVSPQAFAQMIEDDRHERASHLESKILEYITGSGNSWTVHSHSGKSLGHYTTQAAAKKRLRQIEYFKHKGENKEIISLAKSVCEEFEKFIGTYRGWAVPNQQTGDRYGLVEIDDGRKIYVEPNFNADAQEGNRVEVVKNPDGTYGISNILPF